MSDCAVDVPQYVLRQSIYRPRTTEGNNDERSSPTITDDTDVVLATSETTTMTNNEQHPADVTSASEMTDSVLDAPQLTSTGVGLTATSARSSVVDDRDNTAHQEVAEDQTTDVVSHRTQPSAWDRPHSTADDPATTRLSRRVGLFAATTTTMADASPPTSLNPSTQNDTRRHLQFQQPPHQQLPKLQQWSVVCENGVCRLRVATSNDQCRDDRSSAISQASTAAACLPSTTVRDAKSVRSRTKTVMQRKPINARCLLQFALML